MPDHGLLTPGIPGNEFDDVALARAIVDVEVAWVTAQVKAGLVEKGARAAVQFAAEALLPLDDETAANRTTARLAAESAASGSPVLPLLARLRQAVAPVDPAAAEALHRGLSDQDVVDTAVVLVMRSAARRTHDNLRRTRAVLVDLVERHRSAPVLAHTLGQAGIPTTFGARAATWLQATAEAEDHLSREADALPVAFGGAVGTLEAIPQPARISAVELVESFADQLELRMTPGPWHVTRFPVLRVSFAFAEVCAALGNLAADVLAGSRPERAELQDSGAGDGSSASGPTEDVRPLRAVLLRRSALSAPSLLAQVTIAAGRVADEGPDGAWHVEWQPALSLARHAAASAALAAELAGSLEFSPEVAARHLDAFESGDDSVRDASIAAVQPVIDRILARYASTHDSAPERPAKARLRKGRRA